ncbi:hypothetical protein K3720_11965 [Leisingera caerulea]|uniref:hypothetical protein n=1 Tax=Leisingera caerulea TaxID=506591 RepID=UPI0021A2AD43|nr:hypothetical protein [Leisingera caerulea]UWQ48647.1 hypothetical protein K3720_11965 [Leisingera caerulea]
MNRTETFFLSAVSSLVIFSAIQDGSAAVLHWTRKVSDGAISDYESIVTFVITVLIISAITTVFLFVERLFQDRSQYKYSEALAAANRKAANVARDINIEATDKDHWKTITRRILEQIHNSFEATNNNPQLPGKKYSVSLLFEDGGVLRRDAYFSYSEDELFEPVADTPREFSQGSGFAGVAWQTGFPQSGDIGRFWRRERRYVPPNDSRSLVKSYFCTRICRDQHTAVVLCIASDSRRDFPRHQRHADSLHYGLQPVISLLEYCVSKLKV